VTEAEFQKKVTDLCDWLRLKWHHETDSRRSKAGFPDLVIVGEVVLFVELKTERGKVTFEQNEWIDALRAAGCYARVWRPSDWPQIEATLKWLAGRTL
jgi:hypothetical protein